jgi:hypothetical protein
MEREKRIWRFISAVFLLRQVLFTSGFNVSLTTQSDPLKHSIQCHDFFPWHLGYHGLKHIITLLLSPYHCQIYCIATPLRYCPPALSSSCDLAVATYCHPYNLSYCDLAVAFTLVLYSTRSFLSSFWAYTGITGGFLECFQYSKSAVKGRVCAKLPLIDSKT